ncbi:MAG: putative endonuclease [Candidatus Omnitrophota bacterium]|jgi:putative endonuclease
MDTFFLYILQSESSGRFYIGSTSNLIRRYHEHSAGKSRSTRGRGPWRMVYSEEYASRSEAIARERLLKKAKSSIYLRELILQNSAHIYGEERVASILF